MTRGCSSGHRRATVGTRRRPAVERRHEPAVWAVWLVSFSIGTVWSGNRKFACLRGSPVSQGPATDVLREVPRPVRSDEPHGNDERVTTVFDHPIIDVTLGLVFFIVILSLVASAVQEWIASLCALRSKNVRSGVENLIGKDFAKEVYRNPLVSNLAKKGKLPSYIAAGNAQHGVAGGKSQGRKRQVLRGAQRR